MGFNEEALYVDKVKRNQQGMVTDSGAGHSGKHLHATLLQARRSTGDSRDQNPERHGQTPKDLWSPGQEHSPRQPEAWQGGSQRNKCPHLIFPVPASPIHQADRTPTGRWGAEERRDGVHPCAVSGVQNEEGRVDAKATGEDIIYMEALGRQKVKTELHWPSWGQLQLHRMFRGNRQTHSSGERRVAGTKDEVMTAALSKTQPVCTLISCNASTFLRGPKRGKDSLHISKPHTQ